MAGSGKKTFTAGDVLTASDVNNYLMDQTVMVFAGTAARSSAIPTPSEGMVSYQKDTDAIEAYDGSNWVTRVSPSVPFATSANTVSFSAPASVPGSVAVTVTFPASRFTQTPVVVLVQTSSVNAVQRRFAAQSASSTGFTAGYYQDNGSAATSSVGWIAIQMTSASGVG
jgi:hypothetical protein